MNDTKKQCDLNDYSAQQVKASSNVIKVFVSSTFKDLEEERTCLATKVFPNLRFLCHNKGLSFQDLDFRWGITEEECKNGQTIKLCLKGIDDSESYFICILGERYGWVPTYNDVVFDSNQILNDFIEKQICQKNSMTEIEIRYALQKKSIKILFFLKELHCTEEQDRRLQELKNKIKPFFSHSVFKFESTEDLANILYSTIAKDIEEIHTSENNSEIENEIHQDVNKWRRLSEPTSLMGNSVNHYYEQIDQILNNQTNPLWITSENNSIHRYLTAGWIKKNKMNQGIFYFDCNNASSKTDCHEIFLKIYNRVCYLNSIEDNQNYINESDVNHPVGEWIHEIEKVCLNTKIKPLFIIDNLDYCVNFSPRFLQYIDSLSTKIGFIFLSSHSFYKRWGKVSIFRHIHLPLLTEKEVSIYINQYLSLYKKKISVEDIKCLVVNSLYNDLSLLKFSLDILRQYATHHSFKSVFKRIIETNTEEVLYINFLCLVEENYSDKKALLTRIIWLLLESNVGLSINDLQKLTNAPTVIIYEILNALSKLIFFDADKANFANSVAVNAIKKVFYLNESSIEAIDEELINYWEQLEEKIEEKTAILGLSELYIKKSDWDKLYNMLTNISYLYYYMTCERDLFFKRWKLIRKQDSKYSRLPIYLLTSPSMSRESAERQARTYIGIYQISQRFDNAEWSIVYLDKTKSLINEYHLENTIIEAVLYALYAKHHFNRNDISQAISCAKQSLQIRRKLFDENNINIIKAKILLYQILRQTGNFQEINELIQDFDSFVSSPTSSIYHLFAVYEILYDYYKEYNNYSKVKELSKRFLETTNRSYTKDSEEYIECVLYYLDASITLKETDIKEALYTLYNDCSDSDVKQAMVLSNGINMFIKNGLYEDALDWADKEIELCKNVYKDMLGDAYSRKGSVLFQMKKCEEALSFFLMAESEYMQSVQDAPNTDLSNILESYSDDSVSTLANLYNSIGACYNQLSNKQGVFYLQKSIDIFLDRGREPFELAMSYRNLGVAYMLVCKEYRKAVSALSKADTIYEQFQLCEQQIDIRRLLVEANYKAGFFKQAYYILSEMSRDEQLQDLYKEIEKYVLKSLGCIELVKSFREYGENHFSPIATIRLAAVELFLACYNEGLNPVLSENGSITVFLESNNFVYVPNEEYCDTIMIQSFVNVQNATEDIVSDINDELIKNVTKNEVLENHEIFSVVFNNGNCVLCSSFLVGEWHKIREDSIRLLNIAVNITRKIEERYG